MNTQTRIESLESRRLLSAAIPFAEVEAGTAIVRGNVFRDVNRNGVRESTEPAQANVRVYLDYNNNGTRDGDAEPISITNSLGGYRFETARAPETIPVRLLLTGTGLIQTRPTGNAARVVTTTVGGNHELESFGVMEPIVTPPPAVTILTGIVYTDRDRDGTRDIGEPGRANVNVYLDTNENGTREDGEPITRTNGEGRYFFERITSGNKIIRLALAGSGLQQTQPANGQPVRKTVVANTRNEADAFGVAEIIVTPPPVTTAIIRGNVFYDTNNNAQRDSTERGRANVRVYIDLDNDSRRDAEEPTVLTNTLGQYAFERAPVRSELRIRLDLTGTALRQTLPVNNGARALTTVAGQTYVDQNFGVREATVTPPPATTGTLRGRVFNDVNRNGRPDAGDAGVANRSVYIDLNRSGFRDAGDPQTITNIEGRYTFSSVPPGTYYLRLYRGDLTQTSPPNNGSNVAVLTAGRIVADLDFGTYRTETAVAASLVASSAGVRKSDSILSDI